MWHLGLLKLCLASCWTSSVYSPPHRNTCSTRNVRSLTDNTIITTHILLASLLLVSLRRKVNQCGCAEQWPNCVYILKVVYSECSLCAARPAGSVLCLVRSPSTTLSLDR
jgi:hypothetical protein